MSDIWFPLLTSSEPIAYRRWYHMVSLNVNVVCVTKVINCAFNRVLHLFVDASCKTLCVYPRWVRACCGPSRASWSTPSTSRRGPCGTPPASRGSSAGPACCCWGTPWGTWPWLPGWPSHSTCSPWDSSMTRSGFGKTRTEYYTHTQKTLWHVKGRQFFVWSLRVCRKYSVIELYVNVYNYISTVVFFSRVLYISVFFLVLWHPHLRLGLIIFSRNGPYFTCEGVDVKPLK